MTELPPTCVPDGFRWPIVLGIDPGTRVVGYGALVEAPGGPRLLAAGVFNPSTRTSVPERLAVIRAGLDELMLRLKPTVVVVEQAFAAINVQSALRIGEGRGVVLSSAAAYGAEVVQLPPASAKKALTGNGSATKPQVAAMVASLLGLDATPRPLDVTDALALALAEVQRRRGLHALAGPAGSKPAGSKPAGSKPAGLKPAGLKPAGLKPAGLKTVQLGSRASRRRSR